MTRDTAERARECHYELFRWDGSHYCHLPPEHEGEHEWFYTRKQVTQIQAEATLAEHESHVQFESELYAILVDPVAEGSIKEAEMRKQLLESARWYRQRVYDLESNSQKVREARLEEAQWWHTQVALAYMCDEQEMRSVTRQRIAALAQALQPEEKEGTIDG